MAAKVVEVICPNGRRNKVKTTPSMTLLEVLMQTCSKFEYNHNEYDLKHQKKILSTTSLMRFLNLPNNAKLEMVKLTKPRKESNPTVALQLDDGTRLTGEFSPDTSLYSLLEHFQNKGSENLIKPGVVCVYMRNEYKTTRKLKNTSLRSMGVTSGRVVIRINYREPDDDDDNDGDTMIDADDVTKDAVKEPNEKKIRLDENKQSQDFPQTTCELSNQASLSSTTTNEPEQIMFAAPTHDRLPSNATVSRSVFSGGMAMDYTMLPEQVTSSVSSHGNNEFANFKFPDKPNDDEEDQAIDPIALREEVRLAMPCDRHPILFTMEAKTKEVGTKSYSETDDFYDVTVEDLRRRMLVLTSAKKSSEDTMLMTKAMREKRDLEKASAVGKIAIRFILPQHRIIQAFFRPLETVSTLKEFLRDYLNEETKHFDIFTTPPKRIFKDGKETLFKAKLYPASLIHVSIPTGNTSCLKEHYLKEISSQKEAEQLLENFLSHKSSNSTSNSIPSTTRQSTTSQTNSSKNITNNNGSTSSGQQQQGNKKYGTKPTGAPKWFKSGK